MGNMSHLFRKGKEELRRQISWNSASVINNLGLQWCPSQLLGAGLRGLILAVSKQQLTSLGPKWKPITNSKVKCHHEDWLWAGGEQKPTASPKEVSTTEQGEETVYHHSTPTKPLCRDSGHGQAVSRVGSRYRRSQTRGSTAQMALGLCRHCSLGKQPWCYGAERSCFKIRAGFELRKG